MIHVKTEQEIDLMREPCAIVRDTLAYVGSKIRPGVSTAELDELAEGYIRSRGAIPSCLGYSGYPASICASVNEVVVHGIPGERYLREGDIVSIDLCAYKNGFHGDGARTFAVGKIDEGQAASSSASPKNAFGKRWKTCARAPRCTTSARRCRRTRKSNGFSVVREFVGHGIGREMHEDPSVPNYGKRGTGVRLRAGHGAVHRADDPGGRAAGARAGGRLDGGHRRRQARGALRKHRGHPRGRGGDPHPVTAAEGA